MQNLINRLLANRKKLLVWVSFVALGTILLTVPPHIFAQGSDVQVDARGIPLLSFGEMLTFIIRLFFFIAGLAALIYGLWGAISWITSGGGAEEVKAARDKIQAAIVGIFILIVVLSVIVALEQIVFNRQLCFGLSCPVKFPSLKVFPFGCTSVDDCCSKMRMNAGSCANGAPPPDEDDESKATCTAPDTEKVNVPLGATTGGSCNNAGNWEHEVICCTP